MFVQYVTLTFYEVRQRGTPCCRWLKTGRDSAVCDHCMFNNGFICVCVSLKRLDVNVFGFMSRDQNCRRVHLQVKIFVRLLVSAWLTDMTAFIMIQALF